MSLASRHTVILLHGLPGTGKSVLARGLSADGRYKIVSLDPFWKKVPYSPVEASSTQRSHLYRRGLVEVCKLAKFSDVIFDCTSRSKKFRAHVISILTSRGLSVILLRCCVSPKIARRRVAERLLEDPQHPGRGASHFDAIALTFEPLDRDDYEMVSVIDVDTSRPILSVRNITETESIARTRLSSLACRLDGLHVSVQKPITRYP